jgi:CheY-like chemotaxis protein
MQTSEKESTAKRKVLIIEDDNDLVGVLRLRLEAAGFNVQAAQDGEAGLDKVRTFNPDVVLLDLVMPRLDGIEVGRRLRADPATRDLPVISMTALNEPGMEERLHEVGIDDIVRKPFDPQSLVELLNRPHAH